MKYLLFHFILVALLLPNLTAQTEGDRLINDGIRNHQSGKHQEAIGIFTQYLNRISSKNPTVYRHRGFSYYYTHQYDLAIQDFKKAQQIAPGQTDAAFALGKIYYTKGDYSLSISYFNEELSLHPDNAKAHNDRGMVKCRIRDYDSAIHDFEEAFRLDSTFAMAYNNAGAAKYYNQDIDNPIKKDIELARNYFSKAIELDPTLAIAYRNRGAMHLFLKKYEQALNDLKIAGKLQPDLALIPFYRAIVQNKMGKSSAALKSLEQAVVLNHQFQYAYEEKGDIHFELEQYPDAIEAYGKAIRYTSDKNDIYKGLIHFKIARIEAIRKNSSEMHNQLAIAKRLGAFRDKKVYQQFLKDKSFTSYRSDKKLRKFTKSINKIKKEYKFITSELRWFRMND